MARILCTWEFGAGLGHLTRLSPVARRLAEAGHEIVMAVPSPERARPAVEKAFPAEARVRLIQGHSWPAPTQPDARKVPTHSFADVIQLFGFHEPERLAAMARCWDALLEEVRPDLIVADFSPTLLLANAGARPVVVVGNGYTVPPAGRALPPMRPWDKKLPDFSLAHEAELLVAVNRVRGGRGQPSVGFFADLFSGDRTFVCTIPEFDPYGPHRTSPTLIPFNIPRIDRRPPIAERQPPAVFAYLPGNHPLLRPILAGLSGLDMPSRVYVSDIDPQKVAQICSANVAIHRKPADLSAVLPTLRAVIHHAGLATAYAGLLAGTPQLLLPVNLEHSITARGVEQFGAGLTLPIAEKTTAEVIGRAVKLLSEPERQAATLKAADLVAARPTGNALETVVAGCLELLG